MKGEEKLILIVEPSLILARGLQGILERGGFNVVVLWGKIVLSNAQSVLQEIRQNLLISLIVLRWAKFSQPDAQAIVHLAVELGIPVLLSVLTGEIVPTGFLMFDPADIESEAFLALVERVVRG